MADWSLDHALSPRVVDVNQQLPGKRGSSVLELSHLQPPPTVPSEHSLFLNNGQKASSVTVKSSSCAPVSAPYPNTYPYHHPTLPLTLPYRWANCPLTGSYPPTLPGGLTCCEQHPPHTPAPMHTHTHTTTWHSLGRPTYHIEGDVYQPRI